MSIEKRINYIKEHTVVLNSNVKHELDGINNFNSSLKGNKRNKNKINKSINKVDRNSIKIGNGIKDQIKKYEYTKEDFNYMKGEIDKIINSININKSVNNDRDKNVRDEN